MDKIKKYCVSDIVVGAVIENRKIIEILKVDGTKNSIYSYVIFNCLQCDKNYTCNFSSLMTFARNRNYVVDKNHSCIHHRHTKDIENIRKQIEEMNNRFLIDSTTAIENPKITIPDHYTNNSELKDITDWDEVIKNAQEQRKLQQLKEESEKRKLEKELPKESLFKYVNPKFKNWGTNDPDLFSAITTFMQLRQSTTSPVDVILTSICKWYSNVDSNLIKENALLLEKEHAKL